MDQATQPVGNVLDLIVQVILIVVPILITWFVRTYVKGSTAEREIAAIVRLSNTAIDYAENLDKRGELDVPTGVSRGIQKLGIASNWLESELNRAGVKINNEQAQQWVSAEFQKRVGDVRLGSAVGTLTQEAVEMVRDLEQRKVINLPPGADRLTYFAGLGADWVVAGLAKNSIALSREEAMTYVRAALLRQLHVPDESLPQNERLLALAQKALDFLDGLKAGGQLQLKGTVELDVAVAWLVAEAAKQKLAINSAEINEAIQTAIAQRHQVTTQPG